MKIGILIPATSKGRNWTSYKESYLFQNTLKSFLITYNQEYTYVFYIGIDRNDAIYDNENNKKEFERFVSIMKNVSIQFIYMDNITKGHLTLMWNLLFKHAYDEKCDYFFQCGDDIEYKTKNWIKDCIEILKKNNNVGLTGPINNNARLLTQSFVSRNHMIMFNYYFPPEIINWFCDDWINEVYRCIGRFFPLKQHFCINMGGEPRYTINNQSYNNEKEFMDNHNNMRQLCTSLVQRDLNKLKK